MILQKEIITIAEQKGILKSTIDKDWVLGHFLGAIYSEPKLREALIFKGGTCLKKCWFPDYRFSEGLDFTSKDSAFELKQSHLDFICRHMKENAGILSQVESLSPLKFKDKLTGYEAVIRFWGSDRFRNIYYLHGALFLFNEEAGQIAKIRRGGKADELLDLIRLKIHLGQMPVIVSEGKARLKEETIARNRYLSFCRSTFHETRRPLVIHGFSFSDYDDHLIADLNRNRRRLAIGLYLAGSNESQIVRKIRNTAKKVHKYQMREIKFYASNSQF